MSSLPNLLDQIPNADRMIDFYTWSRDAALTLRMIVDEFLLGEKHLESYIEDYIHSQAVLQYKKPTVLSFYTSLYSFIDARSPQDSIESQRCIPA